jgi:hypothetical protein
MHVIQLPKLFYPYYMVHNMLHTCNFMLLIIYQYIEWVDLCSSYHTTTRLKAVCSTTLLVQMVAYFLEKRTGRLLSIMEWSTVWVASKDDIRVAYQVILLSPIPWKEWQYMPLMSINISSLHWMTSQKRLTVSVRVSFFSLKLQMK